MDDDTLIIYTDGSCFANPRRAGVGFKLKFPDNCGIEDQKFSPLGYKGANIVQAELQSCVLALKEARKILKRNKCFRKIIIYTDCQFIVDHYQTAMFRWSNNRYKKSSGAPVANITLWKNLVSNIANIQMRVEIKKVKAHGKDEDNREVDRLAKKSAKRKTYKVLIPTIVRRKHSQNAVQRGCIEIKGQEILIKIDISLERTKKMGRYKYEVIDEESEFYQYVDEIYCEKVLKPGHKYLVIVNDKLDYPQITKIIKEIDPK